MQVKLPFDQHFLEITVPDSATVLRTTYPTAPASPEKLLTAALRKHTGRASLQQALAARRAGRVVIVVSDITRPVPYPTFLPILLEIILQAGVSREELLLLIATGMHRPSTPQERLTILGSKIVEQFQIEDHTPEADLVELPFKSRSGNVVMMNRKFVEAGFRLTTGLVEPHYMAGFSGGRKAVCPGLASLETVRRFHGYAMLADPHAATARLHDNPCHLEALSVAQGIGVDFSINVVLNERRQMVRAFTGNIDAAHRWACDYVQQHANPLIRREYDVVLTSSAGYPLDATFYQSTKSFVCALPAVKPGGKIIAVGGCREGIGSREYQDILFRYADDWQRFLRDISQTDKVIKDQWQHQMHTRALEKIGRENILFVTDALPQETLERLSVNGRAASNVQQTVQRLVDESTAAGESLCVIPEGPYCSPIRPRSFRCVLPLRRF